MAKIVLIRRFSEFPSNHTLVTIAYLIHPEGRKGIWVSDFCAVEENVSNPLNMEVTLLPTESRVNCTTPVPAAAKQEIQKLRGSKAISNFCSRHYGRHFADHLLEKRRLC